MKRRAGNGNPFCVVARRCREKQAIFRSRFLADRSYRFHDQSGYVVHCLRMPRRNAAISLIARTPHGTHFLDHLAADGTGFPGGQVTVVAVLQIHADLPWCPFYILNSPNTGTVEGI